MQREMFVDPSIVASWRACAACGRIGPRRQTVFTVIGPKLICQQCNNPKLIAEYVARASQPTLFQ